MPAQPRTVHESNAALPDRVSRLFGADTRAALVALRRDLHAHPELSGVERRTADRLEHAIREIAGVEGRRVATTGVVARIPGREPSAPVIAIRGDIDALPIAEETGLDFASTAPGVMHACGHDIHAAWAIGAASLLVGRPARAAGLVAPQPAAETGRRARAVLERGALGDV